MQLIPDEEILHNMYWKPVQFIYTDLTVDVDDLVTVIEFPQLPIIR